MDPAGVTGLAAQGFGPAGCRKLHHAPLRRSPPVIDGLGPPFSPDKQTELVHYGYRHLSLPAGNQPGRGGGMEETKAEC